MPNIYTVITVKTKDGERYAVAKNGKQCDPQTFKRHDAAEYIRQWYEAINHNPPRPEPSR